MTTVANAVASAAWSPRVPAQTRRRVQRALKGLCGLGSTAAFGYRERVFSGVRKVALAWGGSCVSATYDGYKVPLEFECAAGHHFPLSITVLRRGGWCQTCHYGRATVHSIEEARQLAAQHGGLCLSASYEHTRAKLRWRCAAGHEWQATFEGVLRGTGARPVISSASSRATKISNARPSSAADDVFPRMSTRKRRWTGNAPRDIHGPRHGFGSARDNGVTAVR